MFKGRKNQSEKLQDFSHLHSLELIFELVKERNAIQMDQADKLDAKAYSVMTSATALISAALILLAVLPTSRPSFSSILNGGIEIIPLLLLLLTYLAVMVIAILAYKLRNYHQTANPNILFYKYLDKPQLYTKAKVLRSALDDYNKNEKEINAKIKWNKWAIRALWAETMLFVAFLLFHTIH